jgi:hypothetical protein
MPKANTISLSKGASFEKSPSQPIAYHPSTNPYSLPQPILPNLTIFHYKNQAKSTVNCLYHQKNQFFC